MWTNNVKVSSDCPDSPRRSSRRWIKCTWWFGILSSPLSRSVLLSGCSTSLEVCYLLTWRQEETCGGLQDAFLRLLLHVHDVAVRPHHSSTPLLNITSTMFTSVNVPLLFLSDFSFRIFSSGNERMITMVHPLRVRNCIRRLHVNLLHARKSTALTHLIWLNQSASTVSCGRGSGVTVWG